jgi:hypothetical protein
MPPPPAPRKLDWLAAVLSYLLPGLGQVLQGRIAKGLLFFVCLYALFFYGLWLGKMKNVWLPGPAALVDANGNPLPDVRVGDVALKGLLKSLAYRPQFAGQFWIGVAAWPAVFQYAADPPPEEPPRRLAVIGTYMRTPGEKELNDLQRDGNKRWDLGWVYTLIAGVLNLLVIYDALAGPAIRDDEPAGGADKGGPA